MNKRIVISALAVVLMGLAGCSSTGGADSKKDQSATLDYRRQGIKITYDSSGKIDAIEVVGYAAVWGTSENAKREAYRVAELEAKKTLNDFINKETITSTVSLRMISQNLEQARDRNLASASNKTTGGGDGELVALDEDSKNPNQSVETSTNSNSQLRSDATRIASRVSTTITTNNRGILGGLYMVDGRIVNDGKQAQVILRWDQKSNKQRQTLRNLMSQ
jgi:uncharacterized protein with FMN-binding domain